MLQTLKCSTCNEEKELTAFHVKRNEKRGYTYDCKLCTVLKATIKFNNSTKTSFKVCLKCKEEKNRTEFYSDNAKPDKLSTYCKACTRLNNKARFKANREHELTQSHAYQLKHAVERRVYHKKHKATEAYQTRLKQWRLSNRSKLREWYKRWASKNTATIRWYNLKYRIRKMGARGDATITQIAARIEMWGDCCWICRAPYQAVDHVIPLIKGGTNWVSNLRPICKSCNSRKGGKHPKDLGLWPILTTRKGTTHEESFGRGP